MSGWHVSVYRNTEGENERGARIADWYAGDVDWIVELVKENKAIDLGFEGLLWRFTASARDLIPGIDQKDLNVEIAGACGPEEWLLVDAWDMS